VQDREVGRTKKVREGEGEQRRQVFYVGGIKGRLRDGVLGRIVIQRSAVCY
jgi:hypothetical protein